MARVGTVVRAVMLAGLLGLGGCQGAPAGKGEQGSGGKGGNRVVFWGTGGGAGCYRQAGAEQLYRKAKYKEAEAMCQQAISAIEKSKGPKSWELAEPLNDLATVYLRQARWADAKTVIDRAESVLD